MNREIDIVESVVVFVSQKDLSPSLCMKRYLDFPIGRVGNWHKSYDFYFCQGDHVGSQQNLLHKLF